MFSLLQRGARTVTRRRRSQRVAPYSTLGLAASSRGVLTSSFGPVARPLTFRGSSMKRRVRITQTRAATEAMLIRVIDDSGTNGRIKEPGSTLTVALASKTLAPK